MILKALKSENHKTIIDISSRLLKNLQHNSHAQIGWLLFILANIGSRVTQIQAYRSKAFHYPIIGFVIFFCK